MKRSISSLHFTTVPVHFRDSREGSGYGTPKPASDYSSPGTSSRGSLIDSSSCEMEDYFSEHIKVKKPSKSLLTGRSLMYTLKIIYDCRSLIYGLVIICLLAVFVWQPILYHLKGSYECTINFKNIPTDLVESNIWSTDFRRRGRTKHLTFHAVYNPSIVHMSDGKFLFTGRMSWNYDTDCAIFPKGSKAEYYCLLAYSDRWQDTSLLGVYDDATCTANIHTNDIFDDINEEWINGSNWYDTKLLSLKPTVVKSTETNRNVRLAAQVSEELITGLWMTSQKSEIMRHDEWAEIDIGAKDSLFLIQMMHMTYHISANSTWTGMSRAVYYDPDLTHWTRASLNKFVGKYSFSIFDIVYRMCEPRPKHLPQIPTSSEFGVDSVLWKKKFYKKPKTIFNNTVANPKMKNIAELFNLKRPASRFEFKQISSNHTTKSKLQKIKWESTASHSTAPNSPNMPTSQHEMQGRRRLAAVTHGFKGVVKDKNWAPFLTSDYRILWSYSLQPHVVCENDIDIRKFESDCVICYRKYASRNDKLFVDHANNLLTMFVGGFEGEGQLPPYDKHVDFHLNGVVTHKIVNADFYVGIAHAKVSYKTNDVKNRHENSFLTYVHFFYKMSSEPPYNIIAISSPIDLSTGHSLAVWFTVTETADVAFVSGFEYLPEEVGKELIIAYGYADRDSKILRMGVAQLNKYFTNIL